MPRNKMWIISNERYDVTLERPLWSFFSISNKFDLWYNTYGDSMLKKLMLVCLLFLLTGCFLHQDEDDASLKKYNDHLDSIVNNAGIVSEHIPFEYKMDVVKQKDKTYRYEISIFNPQQAMYDIEFVAMDPTLNRNEYIFPCIGVLGEDADQNFHMIPYQAASEKGYVRLLMLDALSLTNPFTINVMVQWKDASLQNISRVFFNCHYAEETSKAS